MEKGSWITNTLFVNILICLPSFMINVGKGPFIDPQPIAQQILPMGMGDTNVRWQD